jgi:endonuclease YncB( thermonuclease family)
MTQWTVPAKVIDVVDGDTVRLQLDLGWHVTYTARVRIAAINSPEMKTPEGLAAKQFAQTLLQVGDEVTFVSRGFDKYGRPLGHLIFGGFAARNFGDEMVFHGYAQRVDW